MLSKLVPALAILAAGCLAAGCGSGSISNALPSASGSRSVSFSPPSFSPGSRSPRPSAPPTEAAQPTETTPAGVAAPSPELSSSSPAASESGSSLLWLWILLGVIVVVIVAVLIARRSGRRSAAAASWRTKVVDAYAKGAALHDAMSAAEAPGAQATGDADARWADIQRRADDLSQELYALREIAPGEPERLGVEDVLASLQAVRSAMGAERTQGAVGPAQEARVLRLLQSFAASLRALRSPDEFG